MNNLPKTEEEWRKKLTPEQYRVMREKGTEPPFSGEYLSIKGKGMYKCAGCGAELFSSDAKFDSGTGWPSFSDALSGAVEFRRDARAGPERIEALCKKCGGHLGHVFDDGPAEKGGKRYCINSVCLDLAKK